MKKLLSLLLISIFCFSLIACGTNEKDMALNHLKNKYDNTFEIVSFYGENIDMPYDEIVVKDENDERFAVYIEKNEKGKTEIQDGYYGILKNNEYKEMVEAILNKYLSEYKHFTSFWANYFDNKYDSNYPLKDAIKENNMQFYSSNYIFITEDISSKIDESVYEQLVAELKENGFTLLITIHSVSNEEFLDIDENKDVTLFLPNDYRVEPVFTQVIK